MAAERRRVAPPYVSLITSEIALEGVDRELARTLVADGLDVRGGALLGRRIPLAPAVDDATLAAMVIVLRAHGLAFLVDHRQGMCPSSIAKDLRDKGLVSGPLPVCAFDGTTWIVRDE